MESDENVNKLTKKLNKRKSISLLLLPLLLISLLVVMTLVNVAGIANQTTVDLGTAESFAVLAGAGITNTGPTTIIGDVGSHPTTTQTGFETVTLIGNNHMGDAVTQQAKTDLVTATMMLLAEHRPP